MEDCLFISRRSPVLACNGMVSSSQPLASEIGLQVLKSGGNACDAAIAVAAALSVLEPCSTGLGGDCFMLHYDASTKKVEALNGSGRCPRGLTLGRLREELFGGGAAAVPPSPPGRGGGAVAEEEGKHGRGGGEGGGGGGGEGGGGEGGGGGGAPPCSPPAAAPSSEEGLDRLPTFHAHTVTVPGAAAGWCDSLERWGSGKMTLAEVLAPAAALAEAGFPVAPLTAEAWGRGEPQLRQSRNAQELLSPATGRAPAAGEVFRNPGLAAALRDLGAGGKDAFYGGWVGLAIVEEVQAHGGCLTLADLQAHASTFPEPVSAEYRGHRVWEVPPNGQGITALLALNILKCIESQDEAEYKHNSPEYLHKVIEALRIAFADTHWYCADPAKVAVPVAELLGQEYAARRARLFSPDRAAEDLQHGHPVASSCTVSFQVVDKNGNAVSFVNSNYMGFGTGLIPSGCGFTLQNRGHNFSLDPDHPNCLSPGKRPYHTIIPSLITSASTGELFATFSNMGGFMQPQGHVQLALNLLEHNMDPQTAVDQPRFCILDGSASGAVALEEGIPKDEETAARLRALGHQGAHVARGHDRTLFGRAQIILKRPNGVLWAGSDGRCDGCAMGW